MISVSLNAGELNELLRQQLPPDASVTYGAEGFRVLYRVPLLGRAEALATPYLQDNRIGVSLPFSRMRLGVLGAFTEAAAAIFWRQIAGVIEKFAAIRLRQYGLPSDLLEVRKGMDGSGAAVGFIDVRLDRLHAWIDEQLRPVPLSLRVTSAGFDASAVHLAVDLKTRQAA